MTTTTTTPTCRCGTRHRTGVECRRGLTLRAHDAQRDEVLAALRTLPPNTLVLLDERTGRASARTLRDGDTQARVYADGCADDSWGTDVIASDGTVVRFATTDGGAVPNSYDYAASADRCDVVAADTRVLVWVRRVDARRRPFGRGEPSDQLLPTTLVQRALDRGERYNACWLVAVHVAVRWERLAHRQAAGLSLDTQDAVQLDQALEQGWI